MPYPPKLIFNAPASRFPPRGYCAGLCFRAGKGLRTPHLPPRATPREDCLDSGSSLAVTGPWESMLWGGVGGRRWEIDLGGYQREVGADLDCLPVKRTRPSGLVRLNPRLPSLRPYWSAVMTSWQASSTQLPAVEVGCSPMNLRSGVVDMPQEYTMTWERRWGEGGSVRRWQTPDDNPCTATAWLGH